MFQFGENCYTAITWIDLPKSLILDVDIKHSVGEHFLKARESRQYLIWDFYGDLWGTQSCRNLLLMAIWNTLGNNILLTLHGYPSPPHRQYVVLVPSQLDAGVPEKACVNLQHLNETVTLNIILQYERQTTNLLTGQTVEKDSFYCSPFTVSVLPGMCGTGRERVTELNVMFSSIKRKNILRKI